MIFISTFRKITEGGFVNQLIKKFWPYYMGAATSNWCTVIIVYNLYLPVQIEFFSRYSEVDL